MPFKEPRLLFLDVLDATERILKYCAMCTSSEQLREDDFLRSAVERQLLIIAEAAIRLASSAEMFCPEVAWPDIRGLGNHIRHGYDALDYDVLWNIIRRDLPALQAAVGQTLVAMPPEEE